MGVEYSDGALTFSDENGGSVSISDTGELNINADNGSFELNPDGSYAQGTYNFGPATFTVDTNGDFSASIEGSVGSGVLGGSASGTINGTITSDGIAINSANITGTASLSVPTPVGPVGAELTGSFDYDPNSGWTADGTADPTFWGQPLGDIAQGAGDFIEDALTSTPFGGWFANRDEYIKALLDANLHGIGDPEEIHKRYLAGLDPSVNDNFNDSKNFVPRQRDPLAIDLDGDGIETVGADGTVLFDHDADGIKTGTGWVAADDGLLVLDRNGNGNIDTGAELFGVDTVKTDGSSAVDGFDALSDLDSNSDGIFDQQDAEFANVQIWQDLDQNGVSDTGELTSLTEAGIVSIDLNAESNNVNLGNGNVQTATSTHLTVEGEEGTTGNLDLAHNPFYSEFTDTIPLTEAAQKLPDSRGSGMVRDLREAMSLSSELAAIVASYSSQSSYVDQRAQLDTLVEAWADTSTMQTSIELAKEQNFNLLYMLPGQTVADFNEIGTVASGNGGGSDSSITLPDPTELEAKRALMAQQENVVHMISVLERFNGDQFVAVEPDSVTTGAGRRIVTSSGGNSSSVTNPNSPRRAFVVLSEQQIDLLARSYQSLKELIYSDLISQTRLDDYIGEIAVDFSGGAVPIDFTGMNKLLNERYAANPNDTLADAIELVKYTGDSLVKSGWNGLGLISNWVESTENTNDVNTILADLGVENSSDNITRGNDFIIDSNGDSTINAGSGDDIVLGGQARITLMVVPVMIPSVVVQAQGISYQGVMVTTLTCLPGVMAIPQSIILIMT